MATTIIGRKPSQPDLGYGTSASGVARGSIMGRVTSHSWLIGFGGRMGRVTGTTPSVTLGAYTAPSGIVTTRLGVSGPISPSTLMADAWSGADYTSRPAAPIKIASGTDLALTYLATGASVTVGQDNSGHRLAERSGQSSLPTPFNATSNDPQGKLSLWAELQANRPPETPSGLAPANNATVTTTPTLGADFRDPDEELPGFALGSADKVSAYRFEVWDSAKTSRLQDSGKLSASGGQQTARRATWTPSALASGRYVMRCTMWDQFDVPSPVAEWVVTVTLGGAVSTPTMQGGFSLGTNPAGYDVIASTTVVFDATWTHASGISMDTVTTQCVDAKTGAVTGVWEYAKAATNNQAFSVTPLTTGMVAGGTYRFQIRGRDTNGFWSPWATSAPYVVNKTPDTPSLLTPAGSYKTRPPLYVSAKDVNDQMSLTYEIAVRPQGNSGNGSVIPGGRMEYNPSPAVMIADFGEQQANVILTSLALGDALSGTTSGYARGLPNATEMASYGDYEYRSRAIDPWNAASAWSAWRAVTWVAPPTITITSPGTTITTATPNVTVTSSRTMQDIRLFVFESVSGKTVHDSGVVAASGTTHTRTVPAGVLRNGVTYTFTVWVTTTDGMQGIGTKDITLSYTPPTALASVTATPVPGPFEPAGDPSQWSRIEVAWSQATVGQVSNNEWGGYLVTRVDLATGDSVQLATAPTRDSTVFLDVLPETGVAYRYDVTYLALKNNLDLVESVPKSAEASVTLSNTVLTALDGSGLGVPLRYWDGRNVRHVRDQETIETFGAKPVVFAGPTAYRIASGDFVALDDEYGTYTSGEVIDAVIELSRPALDDEGRHLPRLLWYRDPRGRSFPCVMDGPDENDEHAHDRQRIRISLTEVDTTKNMFAEIADELIRILTQILGGG